MIHFGWQKRMLCQVIGSSNCLPSRERKIPKILGKRGNIILKYVHIHNRLLSAQFYLSFPLSFNIQVMSVSKLSLICFLCPSFYLCLTPLFLLQCVIGIQYNSSGSTALTFTLMIHEAHTLKNPCDHCSPAMWSHIFVFHSSKSFSHTHVCRHTHASHFSLWLIVSLRHTNIYSICTTSSSCCWVNLKSEASTGLLMGSDVSFDWSPYSHRTFLLFVQLALKVSCIQQQLLQLQLNK